MLCLGSRSSRTVLATRIRECCQAPLRLSSIPTRKILVHLACLDDSQVPGCIAMFGAILIPHGSFLVGSHSYDFDCIAPCTGRRQKKLLSFCEFRDVTT